MAWYQEHSPHCTINFEGSFGAMECEAGVEMWLRSIEKNILRYTTFVGDGDSSCFWRVKEACFQKYPDGGYPVNKEECVGHIQKRMGSGLREYKKRMRGQKLPGGKNVGGAGRLTDAVIDRIQSNYGEAIRNNSEIGTMKTAIGCEPKHYMTNALQREDGQRIDFSERKISEKRRSSRQKQRLDRKKKKVDKTAYLSGGFGVSAVSDSTLGFLSLFYEQYDFLALVPGNDLIKCGCLFSYIHFIIHYSLLNLVYILGNHVL